MLNPSQPPSSPKGGVICPLLKKGDWGGFYRGVSKLGDGGRKCGKKGFRGKPLPSSDEDLLGDFFQLIRIESYNHHSAQSKIQGHR